MLKLLRHFLVTKILIVYLTSVYVTTKPLWNIFCITKNIVFSVDVQNPIVKDAKKLNLRRRSIENSAHRTDLRLFRLAFDANDRSITRISMCIWRKKHCPEYLDNVKSASQTAACSLYSALLLLRVPFQTCPVSDS